MTNHYFSLFQGSSSVQWPFVILLCWQWLPRAVRYTPCTTYNSSPCNHATTLQNHTFYTLAHHTNWFVLPPPIATISANSSLKTYYAGDHNITPPLMNDTTDNADEVRIIHQDVLFFNLQINITPLRQRFHDTFTVDDTFTDDDTFTVDDAHYWKCPMLKIIFWWRLTYKTAHDC